MVRYALFSSVLILLLAGTVHAELRDYCEVHEKAEPALCTYEPNTVGFTRDSDDRSFMDFNISVRYQLFPIWMTRLQNYVNPGLGYASAFYFAFTGRFGQYIGTRDSSPVVSKRFNPKLFYRYWTDEPHEAYIDLAFLAHESNGQSIDSPAEYQTALATSHDPTVVNDQLSRGWDYLELVWKSVPVELKDERMLNTFLRLKYFFYRGPLQGRAEEFEPWENNPQGKPRSHVNGIAGMVKYIGKGEAGVFTDFKLAAGYETGYRQPFRFNTFRFELSTKVLQLPMTVWWQRGYNSDLAQYYKKVTSYGVQAEIGSF